MARQRGMLALVVWSAAALGVMGLGCSAQISFMSGESKPSPDANKAVAKGDDASSSSQTDAKGSADSLSGDLVATQYQSPYLQVPGNGNGRLSPTPTPSSLPSILPEEVATGFHVPPPDTSLPRELAKTTLPSYIIEPPDVLFIDAIRIIPRPPYRIEPLDVLVIQVAETLPNQPIGGTTVYPVSPDGTVSLGFSYGAVRVAGLTLEQAAQTIQHHLKRTLNNPQVAVALAQFRGVQQTRGEHLVQMDGTITLGSYGCVHVTGLTLSQAKCIIERHLSRWLLDPEISLSVSAFNSKVYYVIIDGGGYGQQVFRFPITGNETVLDAISQINGLPPISSTRRIWVARPTPAHAGCYQILHVNWQVTTQAGDTETNYQLMPGDRVYVKANRLITFNNYLTQFLTPIENLFGATLLGAGTVNVIRSNNNLNNGF
jgi:polysaccharide biosynthesis/export protein